MTEALPPGWTTVSFGDIAEEVKNGISMKPDAASGTPILRISAVRPRSLNSSDVRYLDPSDDWTAYRLATDDLLFTRYNGNPGLVGVCARVREADLYRQPDLVYPDKLIRVRVNTAVACPGFIERAAHSAAARDFVKRRTKTSAGQVGISGADLKALPVPLPPINEQRRIVAKLDTIFEQTRSAKARLERLPALLDKLERSILAAAFCGDLTADWREEHPDVEPASRLLDRIGVERRTRWEVTLRAKGKDPSKARYAEPVEFDNASIPELPPSWAWTSLSALSRDSGYGTSGKSNYDGSGEGVLRIPNVASGEIDVSDLKRSVSPLGLKPEELIATGDFLVVRTNGSRDLIGRAAFVQDTDAAIGHYFASYLIRFRLVTPLVGRWLSLWWRSPFMRRWLELHAASSAGQYNVSLSTLATAPVPVASPEELPRIVELVEQGFGMSSLLSERFGRSAVAINDIEKSALAKAFRGDLVPQDPNDEPAADLLARLKVQLVSAVAKPPRRGRPPGAPPP